MTPYRTGTRRNLLAAGAASLALPLLGGRARAADYPSRPVE